MFRTEPVTSTVSQTSLLKNKIHLECTPNIVSSREEKKKKSHHKFPLYMQKTSCGVTGLQCCFVSAAI